MFILICGGNGSGKSHVAELISSQIDRPRYYAATMIPFGAEGEARKAKHIKARAGLGFYTVECPYNLSDVECEKRSLVLLEDLSNLLANGMFGCTPPLDAEGAMSQVRALHARCEYLLAVTIAGLTGEGCDESTRDYVAKLNELNGMCASLADVVIEMRSGKACVLKGECPWVLG